VMHHVCLDSSMAYLSARTQERDMTVNVCRNKIDSSF
jgi:hypothetical protein